MENLYDLTQIQPIHRPFVGDKAIVLSQLMQRGYPVTAGFVVSAQVYCEFLDTLNTPEPLVADLPHSYLHLNVDNPYQLQQVAQRLRQEITTAALPDELVDSIRVATEGWETPALMFSPSLILPTTVKIGKKIDGLLESQVCKSEQEAIALTLKQVWSQMFRARCLLIWQQAGIGIQLLKLAVLVQPRTNAIASGLVTHHSGELKIQATWGMETSIIQGEVIPDSYYIQAETGAVRWQQLGNKTFAYNLIDSLSSRRPSTALLPQTASSYLQAYLLSEAQQKQYALTEEHLQQLIQLGQKLSTELGAFALTWTILETDANRTPKPYIIQIDPTAPPSSPPPPAPPASPASPALLLRGLAAAGGRVVAPAHVITHPSQKPKSLPPKVILVAPALTPDWLPLLQQSAGVVTEQGGLTSHSAILARETGIPAVVSATDATQLIQTGESILLDGNRGEVYRAGTSEGYDQAKPSLLLGSEPIGHCSVPTATQLYVNLSQIDSLLAVRGLPVDGVGLLRSELMALAILEGQHPHTWFQQGRKAELVKHWQEQISQFVRALAPQPVFYRSWDWRTSEVPLLKEDTPVKATTHSLLGQRGTFSYLQDSTLFELELVALEAVQQSGYTNFHLILPFVRTVEEFSFCRRLVEQVGLTRVPQFQLWIMAEVPSILFLLPEYVRAGVQGISIGTNDLTQLLLGVDRDQGQLAAIFNERHPVVKQAIAQLIQLARKANIPCSICGQAPALYPELIDDLVQWGITSISVEVDALLATHTAIVRAEKRLMLEAARRQLGLDQ